MTREELIKLKEQTTLAIKFNAVLRSINKNYSSGYLTCNTIQEKDETNEAIANIDNSLSSLVINAAKYGIDIKCIFVDIDWDFFKTKEFIEGSFIPGPEDVNFTAFTNMRVYDYLLIQMQYNVESYDPLDREIIEDKLNLLSPAFIVKYSKFVEYLKARGYEINTPSFDIFLNKNVRSLNFQIDFEPQQKRIKTKN